MRIDAPPHSKPRGAVFDLKLRVPPHMFARSAAHPDPSVALTIHACDAPPRAPSDARAAPPDTPSRSPPYIMTLACVALLMAPLMCAEEPLSPAVYLVVSPVCVHVVLLYYHWNVVHPSHYQLIHVTLASLAFVIGGAGAVMYLFAVGDNRAAFSFPCISIALCVGVCDLMFIVPKGMVARVISCTVCGVLVVLLSCFALISSVPLSHQCYKSACVPLLYLVWQALPRESREPSDTQDTGA